MNWKAVLVLGMSTVLSCVAGCNKGGADGAGTKGEQKQAHSDKTSGTKSEGVAAAIRGKTLGDFKTMTIGEAFDNYRYFDKKEWKESGSGNGKIYVDFWGWFKESSIDAASKKNGIVARGVQIKFVVNPEGEFYVAMISRAEKGADNTEHDYPLDDKQSILNAIYGNKEITF
ncbi:MAG TPA: hypothetical protein VI389_08180 [Geobacteraceae bacterium]